MVNKTSPQKNMSIEAFFEQIQEAKDLIKNLESKFSGYQKNGLAGLKDFLKHLETQIGDLDWEEKQIRSLNNLLKQGKITQQQYIEEEFELKRLMFFKKGMMHILKLKSKTMSISSYLSKILDILSSLKEHQGYFKEDMKYSLICQIINSELGNFLGSDRERLGFSLWGEGVLNIFQTYAPEKFSSLSPEDKQALVKKLYSFREQCLFDYCRTGINVYQGKKLADILKSFLPASQHSGKFFDDNEVVKIMKELMESGLVGRIHPLTEKTEKTKNPSLASFFPHGQIVDGFYSFLNYDEKYFFVQGGKYYIIDLENKVLQEVKLKIKKDRLIIKGGKYSFVLDLSDSQRFTTCKSGMITLNDFLTTEKNQQNIQGVVLLDGTLYVFDGLEIKLEQEGNEKLLFVKFNLYFPSGKTKIVGYKAKGFTQGQGANVIFDFEDNIKSIFYFLM